MNDLKFQNRREFLKYSLGTAAGLAALSAKSQLQLLSNKGFTKLCILYTNDQHSRIEPFPESDPQYGGKGGFARRASVIAQIRESEEHTLLLDAGDIFQGTAYFNYFKGELEYKLMSKMGYDAVTLGNHDFDLGCENIAKQMPHAGFEFLVCNYNLASTALSHAAKISPCKVFKRGPLRIGILGIGIELSNLVDNRYVKDIVYLDPISRANQTAEYLCKEKGCDYVICLSHLGYDYPDRKVSDRLLAAESRNIDLIIGGHTHTYLENPVLIKNKDDKSVAITQMGWAGIRLGRIDLYFSPYKKKLIQNNSCYNIQTD